MARAAFGPDRPEDGSPASDGPPADPESAARGLLLRKLTAAPATRAQLRDLLAGRGVPDDVAEPLLDRFEDVGLIDDAAFADAWVSSRHAGRGLSRRALAHELRGKGVAEPAIEGSLGSITAEDERAAAVVLVRRKLPSVARLDRQAQVRRLVGLLARRGYSSSLALAVVLGEVGEADTHDGDEAIGQSG